jgi:hypothetical protein
MRWRARREGLGTGRWEINSEPGALVGGGRSVTLTDVVAYGNDRSIHVRGATADDEEDWGAFFRVPPRAAPLRAGATLSDAPGDDDVGDPDAFVADGGDGWCLGDRAEVTVQSARYDRRGRLRALRLSFVYACADDAAPRPSVRGTIVFRSR